MQRRLGSNHLRPRQVRQRKSIFLAKFWKLLSTSFEQKAAQSEIDLVDGAFELVRCRIVNPLHA